MKRGVEPECRTWEEEIYWTHFQSTRFCQFLTGDFHSQLEIPKKFSENSRNKLPEFVALKSPNNGKWDVRVVRANDSLLFKDGWADFVTAHCLKEFDLLNFKYDGNSCFEVLLFDGKTLCENERSYFIRNSVQVKSSSKGEKNRKTDVSAEVVEDSDEDSGWSRKKRHRKDGTPEGNDVSLSDPRTPDKTGTSADVRLRHKRVSPDTSSKPKSGNHKNQSKGGPAVDENKDAYERAFKELTDDSFLVVMKPTHVCRKFYLSFPAEWVRENLFPQNQDVKLCMGEKMWLTRFYPNQRQSGGLSGGWKEFAMENRLGLSDICLFKLASNKKDGNPVVNVSIFRATEGDCGKVSSDEAT